MSETNGSFYCVCTDKQKGELTQQHTEWVRQVTQRHMQQIEDLQNEIHTHTQMMALQQVHTYKQTYHCGHIHKQTLPHDSSCLSLFVLLRI